MGLGACWFVGSGPDPSPGAESEGPVPVPTSGPAAVPVTQGGADGPHTGSGPVDLAWIGPGGREARAELRRWRRQVGPPLVHRAPSAGARLGAGALRNGGDAPDSGDSPAGHFVVASWNVGIGTGDLDAFLDDLEEGRWTDGIPARRYAVLIQEAYRPRRRAEEPPEETRVGIGELARARGLHLLYVPARANEAERGTPGDRGSAILSTLPLAGLLAIELPLQAERRVVVSATVELGEGGGEERPLRLVSVHFDHHTGWRRPWRALGRGRAQHAAFLSDALPEGSATVLGGDLNTWAGGAQEEAVRRLRERFPDTDLRHRDPTYPTPFVLPDLEIDHIFFRGPPGWRAEYRVVSESYGSDHRPLVGRVEIAQSSRSSSSPVSVPSISR